MSLETMVVTDMTHDKVEHIVGFLTLRSLEWQNIYAYDDGKPLWTDEQIRRVYGERVLQAWKKQDVCPVHGIIRREGKCSLKHEVAA